MKTNRFFSHLSVLTSIIAWLLGSASLQAQTFRGQEKLSDSPKELEALIYPVSNRLSTIRVNFNNQTGGSVQVVIQDEKGKVVYNEIETNPRYRAYLNLCLLPAGNYTVKLSKRTEKYVQMFTIEPPVMGRITMANGKKPEPLVGEKLILNN